MRNLLIWSLLAAAPLCAQVQVTQGQNKIEVEIDGKPYTDL